MRVAFGTGIASGIALRLPCAICVRTIRQFEETTWRNKPKLPAPRQSPERAWKGPAKATKAANTAPKKKIPRMTTARAAGESTRPLLRQTSERSTGQANLPRVVQFSARFFSEVVAPLPDGRGSVRATLLPDGRGSDQSRAR